MTKDILDYIISLVKREQDRQYLDSQEALLGTRPVVPSGFFVVVRAGALIEPAKKKVEQHRAREQHYTERLAEAEKELREKGVSVELFDLNTGTYREFSGSVCSGNISVPTQNFQPRIDQKLMDNVKNAKNKMMEHRDKAMGYEKYARAFSQAKEREIRLTVEDIHYFGLEY